MNSHDNIAQQTYLGMLHTERGVRYCEIVARKSLLRHQGLTAVLVIASCGIFGQLIALLSEGLATPIAFWFEVTAGVLSLMVAVLAVWSTIANYSERHAVCKLLGRQHQELLVDWKRLWYGDANQADILTLQTRFNAIGNSYPSLADDNAANKEAMDAAEANLQAELQGGTAPTA